jgi:hypothetical protein
MVFFLTFFLSLATASAAPEACSTVELSQQIDGFGAIPRWSQGRTHLCYAYSAASLIDTYRFNHGDKDLSHITSPLLLAVKTIENYRASGSTFSGGKIEHAFATARQFGTCNAKIITDRLGPHSTDVLIESLARQYRDALRTPDEKFQNAEKVLRFLQNSGVKAEDLPDENEIEKNFALNQDEFVSHTLLSFCHDTKKLDYLPAPKVLFQPQASSDAIEDRMQNLLSGHTPVGINFCSNVVTDPHHQGKLVGNKWVCHENLNHSAVVAGRKLINGQCHFLVQDTGCDGYSRVPGACRQNQYWIEVRQLLANTHGIFWLD